MSRSFFTASKIFCGAGAVCEAVTAMKAFGKKALIVTGKTVSTLSCFEDLTHSLSEHGSAYEVFDQIIGEPDDRMINQGVRYYQQSECDFLIGIGGGSPIDAMKAIAVLCSCGGNISDYMGKEISGKLPKMAAIPTTAGTGSEVTQFTVITDSAKNIKMLLKGACLLPDLAIVDSTASLSAPKKITASTGLDALTHAVESYTSRKAQPLTDVLSVSAVRRIFRYLPIAYDDGTNEQARGELAVAALEAGMSINNASVTIVHGMSRPIGALFHVPHGTSNAMLLPACMRFAVSGAYARFADLARAIGAANAATTDETAALAFVEELDALCRKCEIPSPEEYGINREIFFAQIDKMALDAISSGSPANTIRKVRQEDILTIYRSLW